MIEPLYGPGSSLWTNTPASGLGWYSTPFPLASHQIPTVINQPFGSPPLGALAQPLGIANLPPLITPEVPVATLIAAVAMRRGQPQGPTSDHDVEDFLYDVFELLPGASDVEVRCENGRITLAGNVSQKRVKHDLGEVAWALPIANDVQNNITIATRRRMRQPGRERERENEPQLATPGRKPA